MLFKLKKLPKSAYDNAKMFYEYMLFTTVSVSEVFL